MSKFQWCVSTARNNAATTWLGDGTLAAGGGGMAAGTALPQRAAYWVERRKIKPKNLEICNLKERISRICYDDGYIELDSKIVLLSIKSIDYTIIHKLAHLRFFNHNGFMMNHTNYQIFSFQ